MSALTQQWSESIAAQHRDAPTWLAALRRDAARRFDSAGLPGPRTEAWKYTSLRPLERLAPRLALGDPTSADRPEEPALVNGHYNGAALAQGVHGWPLAAALEDDEAGWRPMLESLAMDGPADAFSLMNTATLERGMALRVADGVDAGALTLALRQQPEADDAPVLVNARILLRVGAGASLQLALPYSGTSEHAAAMNLVVQVVLEPGASLRVDAPQTLPHDGLLIERWAVRQDADSRFTLTTIDAGGAWVRRQVGVTLDGERAETDLGGACLVDGRQHIDQKIAVDHVARDARSRQIYRGMAAGRARAVWNGRVQVHPGADGADAQQSNANLLLSPHAEVDTKPELEIYADEVVASHGATVGELDERALFYLRTRGIDEASARRLLVRAFCDPVVTRLDDGEARNRLAETLAERAEALS